MSRYSRIFLRPKDNGHASSWTGDSSSKVSTAEPASMSSPGISYPPSSLPSHDRYSPFAMLSPSSPGPHPYTLGAVPYPAETASREGASTISHAPQNTNTSEFSAGEKPPENPSGHQYHPRTAIPIAPNEPHSSPLPLHLRPIVLLLLFLPIPPLLSLTYVVTGHAVLRAIQSSPNSIFRAPLLSSIEAAATGGVILSLPFALLLYLLFPTKEPTAPEDFFEDDNSSMLGQGRWLRYLAYIVSALLVLCVGGIAGPLGVTCLSSGTLGMFVGDKKMLSTGAAASAGFIGGVLLAFGSLALFILGIVGWTFRMRQSHPPNTS